MSTDLSPAAQITYTIIIVVVFLIVKKAKGFSMKELGSWFLGAMSLPWEMRSTRGRTLVLAALLLLVIVFTVVLVGAATGR